MKICPVCDSVLHDDDIIYINDEGWIVGCSQCCEAIDATEVNIDDYMER